MGEGDSSPKFHRWFDNALTLAPFPLCQKCQEPLLTLTHGFIHIDYDPTKDNIGLGTVWFASVCALI